MQKANSKSTVAPKVYHLNFGMIHCLLRYSRDTGYIKLTVEILSAAPEDAGRNFPFSSLFVQLLGFSFGFGPSSPCRSPEGVCSSLLGGSGSLKLGGREGYGMWGDPAVAEAGMMLHQLEARCVFSRKLSLDHGTLAVPGCTGSREGRYG